MRLPDEMEEKEKTAPTIIAALGAVCFFIIIIIALVCYVNRDKFVESNQGNTQATVPYPEQVDEDKVEIGASQLSPEDFDFWEMYPDNTPIPVETKPQETPKADPSMDGMHTRIVNDSGEEEWVPIDFNLGQNTYDLKSFVCQSDMMKYYKDGAVISYLGVDISEKQGYVDFNKVKKAGIDFCMIRVGARGYGTGQLFLDDNFTDNMKRASDAGLEVGVYFYSQAITEEEVLEEVMLLLDSIKEYDVTYPVAFQMEYVENDTARVEQISKASKTELAQIFLGTVKTSGYTPLLYGKKEWLLKKVDLAKLSEYDVWLSQNEKQPDYPYLFGMWQYTNHAVVDGISGSVNLNVSLIDYSEK